MPPPNAALRAAMSARNTTFVAAAASRSHAAKAREPIYRYSY